MTLSDIETVVADTPAARFLHYRLRYQVFCVETGFEDASRYPDGQEKDEFDECSVPFLVRNKRSGTWLATARLILPSEGVVPPIERYCNVSRNSVSFDQVAELSRLLVVPHVRRRWRYAKFSRTARPIGQSMSHLTNQEFLKTKEILSELLRAMSAYGLECGIPHAAFFITPALARILTRMKIDLTKIGSSVEHRGIRFPYLSEANQVYQALSMDSDCDNYGDTHLRPFNLASDGDGSFTSLAINDQQFGT
jgi:N-acyl amino acid synthase of PEP-CTERM/exosortase system